MELLFKISTSMLELVPPPIDRGVAACNGASASGEEAGSARACTTPPGAGRTVLVADARLGAPESARAPPALTISPARAAAADAAMAPAAIVDAGTPVDVTNVPAAAGAACPSTAVINLAPLLVMGGTKSV